jgi:1-phosphofructokinase family hexose kinase
MLLALTPNPAIDRTLVVYGFRHADVTRVAERHDAAGGKGLNVARVARTLGTEVRALGLLGGHTGRVIADLAEAEGIDARWAWLAQGESRVCLLVSDPAAHDTLVINEHGPLVDEQGWDALETLLRSEVRHASALTSSGSLPPGAPVDRFHSLLADLLGQVMVLLDTSGAVLRGALDLPLTMLKINHHEIGDVLGRSIDTPADAAAAAREVCRRGPHSVVVTLGKYGAVAANGATAWFARTPELPPLSPVGSGDAVMAGAASTLLAGGSLSEALQLGVAAGAANVLTLGAGVVRPDDLVRLLPQITLERLD